MPFLNTIKLSYAPRPFLGGFFLFLVPLPHGTLELRQHALDLPDDLRHSLLLLGLQDGVLLQPQFF